MRAVIILALFGIGAMGLPLDPNDPTGMLNNGLAPMQQPTPSISQSAGDLVTGIVRLPFQAAKGVYNLFSGNQNQNQNPYPNMQGNYPINPLSGLFGGMQGMLSAPLSYLPSIPFFGNQPNQMALQNLQNQQNLQNLMSGIIRTRKQFFLLLLRCLKYVTSK